MKCLPAERNWLLNPKRSDADARASRTLVLEISKGSSPPF